MRERSFPVHFRTLNSSVLSATRSPSETGLSASSDPGSGTRAFSFDSVLGRRYNFSVVRENRAGRIAGTPDSGPKKGEMMKGVSVFVCKVILLIASWIFVLLPCGCSTYGQPGETAAEGRRRHQRVARINQQELMADIDRFLMLDRPSRLTDKRIP